MVLAGGAGTRMRPLTEEMPKALVPVLGKPFADWQLELVAERGVERVLYSVGYRGEMIREHVGDGGRFGLEVGYVDEGQHLRGTGGALRLALDLGELEEAFFVLYGDSYLPVDFGAVERAWEQTPLPALMTVFRNDGQWDRSNAIYDDGRVVLYDKDRPADRVEEMHWIDYGLSILSREVVAERVPPNGVTDLADLMRELSVEGKLAGFEVSERFYEGGSPEGLRDLEQYLSRADQ
ncbi:MAG: sugar phosphate nucleotidyltransferase [Actinomycetota bacterium]